MKRRSLYFVRPERVEIREEEIPAPGEGQVLVRSICSAISPGTEMLAYRGQLPETLAVDENISSLTGTFRYPFQYGYSTVGRVIATGPGAEAWEGRMVFAFQPHETCFTASAGDLMPLPEAMDPETAVFLPNMETAVNFVMDGRPMVGETVGVFGLGIVGLLTTALLAEFPLSALFGFDRYPNRRDAAAGLGVVQAWSPDESRLAQEALLERGSADGFDLLYEVSGSPQALDQALSLSGYAGRVVIGSWYGSKRASLDLGGRFHRSRLHLIASQVSTLAPDLSGRWNKQRRMQVAWDALQRIRPQQWITHRIAFDQAGMAYEQIDSHPEETIQVVLTYD